MFVVCLSEDLLQNEREQSQTVEDGEQRAGSTSRAAAAADATRKGLILLPHAPGAQSGCLAVGGSISQEMQQQTFKGNSTTS